MFTLLPLPPETFSIPQGSHSLGRPVTSGRPVIGVVSRKDRTLASDTSSQERRTRNLPAQAELLRALVARELRARYRGSYLGWVWALVRPLVMLAVYALVVGVFLGAAEAIPDFVLFVFAGLIAWNLFAAIVTGSIESVMASAPLISKASFPRVLVPLAALVVALVDALIQGLVLVLGYVIVGHWPTLQSLTYLGPAFLGIVAFGLGLGLVLAALNVYVRDVGFLTDVGLQVGFWLCPILYSYGLIERAAQTYGWPVEWVTRIYMFNPIANGVLGFQRALWPPASTPEGALLSFPGQLGARLLILVISGAVFLAFAWALFQKLSRNFAQEI